MGNTYNIQIELTDFGPYVHKIILALGVELEACEVRPDQFLVYAERRNMKTGELLQLPRDRFSPERFPSKGYCEAIGAYISDVDGNLCDKGSYITLEMVTRPFYELTAAIAMVDGPNTYIYNDFTISLKETLVSRDIKLEGLTWDQQVNRIMPELHGWTHDFFTKTQHPMTYAYYTPSIVASGKRPLIIWLHGGGEGGSDPLIAYTSNQVVNLAKEDVQAYYGGAYVLVPQCPTLWMDDGVKVFSDSGKTIYGQDVKRLIEHFIACHQDVDLDRVYIGGCSNGGYLTMRMLIDYPELFAAAYPVCEALYDNVISDDEIDRIKDKPIWFTHAKDDTVIAPEITVLPTYKRLIQAGAKDVHFTYLQHVVDNTGFLYEGFGHASWINMLNDDCRTDYDGSPVIEDGEAVTLLEWMAKKKLNR